MQQTRMFSEISRYTKMYVEIVFCLALALATIFCTANGEINAETLTMHLLKDANNAVRPKLDRNDHTTVNFGLALIKIMGLDETHQTLTCKYWTRYSWFNELMTWNSSEWGNIEETSVNANRVWTPDIVLYNEVNNNGGIDLLNSMVTMHSDGKHTLFTAVTFTSSCKVNSQFFPFDVQMCDLKFGSWTLNNKLIVLKADKGRVVGNNYVPSSEWEMLQSEDTHHEVVYAHYGSIPYDDLTYTIRISRKETGYLFFMVTPCLILVCTTLFSFSLPPDSGERMVVAVTNLLCFAIFMMMTNEILPQSSDTISIISVFYLVLMVESSFSVFIACCVLTVYHRGRQTMPPEIPEWLKRLFFNIYVKIFRIEASEEKKDKFKEPLASLLGLTLRPAIAAVYSRRQPSSKAHSEIGGLSLDVNLGSKLYHALSTVANRHSLPIELQNMVVTPQEGHTGIPAMTDSIITNIGKERCSTLRSMLEEIEYITENTTETNRRDTLRVDWDIIGYMLDRLYFWIFVLMALSSSACILITAHVTKYKLAHLIPEHDHAEK